MDYMWTICGLHIFVYLLCLHYLLPIYYLWSQILVEWNSSFDKGIRDEKVEPDSKKRREDMDEDEKKKFDDWLDEIRIKLSDIKEKKQSRLLRRQQMAKRRTAASHEHSWSWVF